jgi:alanyl-tRNA synthetase
MPGFEMEDFVGTVAALEEKGYTPEDITDVIITHADHDHIECVKYFQNATIYIQKDEYESGASFRVISDHIRSVVFLLAQGVNFDKEGRGYVLRRILRRALRHGYLLGIKEPFMYRLVDKVVELMGDHYEYLNEKKEYVKELIKLEEERFLATIAAGLDLFNEELAKTKDIFSGEVAFKLYDTYGFPLDLTADMLRGKGLSVDAAKFDTLMSEQKARAKAGQAAHKGLRGGQQHTECGAAQCDPGGAVPGLSAGRRGRACPEHRAGLWRHFCVPVGASDLLFLYPPHFL